MSFSLVETGVPGEKPLQSWSEVGSGQKLKKMEQHIWVVLIKACRR